MSSLVESERPVTLDAIVGQDRAVTLARRLHAAGEIGGRAFWVAGPSGTGKTTWARCVAALVAHPLCVVELDAADVGLDWLRDAEVAAHLAAPAPGGRVFIINEAHMLSRAAVGRWLTIAEPIPRHCTWIFTDTLAGESELFADVHDAPAFLSRAMKVPWNQRGLAKPFGEYLARVAERVGVNGKPMDYYYHLVQDHANNLRESLQTLDRMRYEQ